MLTALRRNADIIFVTLIFLVSTGWSANLYNSSFRAPGGEKASWNYFPVGTQRYAVIQRDRCVGEVSSYAARGKLYELRINSEIMASLASQRETAVFSAIAFFNPIGQLIQSSFKFNLGSVKASLRTSEVNPLRVSVSVTSNGMHYKRELSMPGPVLLVDDAQKRALRIEYPHLENLGTTRLAEMQLKLFDSLEMTLFPAAEFAAKCGRNERRDLDLAPLLLQAHALTSTFRQLTDRYRNLEKP